VEDILLDGSQRCTSSDISEGGLYLSSIQSFEEGAVTDVAIPVDGDTLTLRAEVRQYQPGIGAGLVFIDLSDEQKLKLRELIEVIANKSG